MEIDRSVLYRAIRESEVWRIALREFAHPVHAYLFLSADRLAVQALVELVCTRVYCPTACGQCVECRKVLGHNKMDVKFVNEWDEKISVATASEMIDDSMLSSFEGGKKVYVINSIDRQSESVQNKLLKTLEEPHEDVIFLLTASTTSSILATVQSRVKTIVVTPFSTTTMVGLLQTMGVADAEALARCSGGDLTWACKLGDDSGYFDLVNEVFGLFLSLDTLGQVCEYIYRPMFEKEKISETLRVIGILFRDLLYYETGLADRLTFPGRTEDYRRLATKYGLGCLAPIGELVEEAKQKIESYCTAANVADRLLAAILEVRTV